MSKRKITLYVKERLNLKLYDNCLYITSENFTLLYQIFGINLKNIFNILDIEYLSVSWRYQEIVLYNNKLKEIATYKRLPFKEMKFLKNPKNEYEKLLTEIGHQHYINIVFKKYGVEI